VEADGVESRGALADGLDAEAPGGEGGDGCGEVVDPQPDVVGPRGRRGCGCGRRDFGIARSLRESSVGIPPRRVIWGGEAVEGRKGGTPDHALPLTQRESPTNFSPLS